MRASSNPFLLERRKGAILVTFNRPEIRSPLSVEVINDLLAVVKSAGGNSEPRKWVFTGVGNVFASGADLREIAAIDQGNAADFARQGQDLMNAIADLKFETIAAINGYCFGGALDLAVSCRTRIASPNAIFAHPGAGLGIMTGWGGTQRLPRLISQPHALEMFFTTDRIDAGRALEVGLIDEIAPEPLRRALE
ncbi:MAG: enoyl-CoA hydratase/isomerase family protein, partial [Acidobacteria bacterium]|nr:enoyl-CoA hydratase/isomerase family protein [Acidobacteriota bacterium]